MTVIDLVSLIFARNQGIMKMNYYLLSVILFFNGMILVAQHLKMEESEHTNKRELIEMGFVLLQEKQPQVTIKPEDFEITAWKNSKEIVVKFRRIIRYIPLRFFSKKRIDFDITVNLKTHEILPFDGVFNTTFYTPTKADQEAIAFVQEKFGYFSGDFENTIREGKEDYFIDCENEYSYGKYTLNKITGKPGPALQGSYIPVSLVEHVADLDILIEIKE